MALNPYIGRTKVWLEAELAKAQQDLSAGKTRIAVGEGTVSSQSMVQQSPMTRIEQILRALYLLDPDAYPLANITRITRTTSVVGRQY